MNKPQVSTDDILGISEQKSSASPTNSTMGSSSSDPLTDHEILSGGLDLLKGANLLQVARTHSNQQILDRVNAGYTDAILSNEKLYQRITYAVDQESKRQGRRRADLKQELNDVRWNNGLLRSNRNYASTGTNASAMKDTNTLKTAARATNAGGEAGTVESNASKETSTADVAELVDRVLKGELTLKVSTGEQPEPEPFERKRYDYEHDGDTTEDESREEQIKRFQERKKAAIQVTPSKAEVNRTHALPEPIPALPNSFSNGLEVKGKCSPKPFDARPFGYAGQYNMFIPGFRAWPWELNTLGPDPNEKHSQKTVQKRG